MHIMFLNDLLRVSNLSKVSSQSYILRLCAKFSLWRKAMWQLVESWRVFLGVRLKLHCGVCVSLLEQLHRVE